jgi:DNA-binding NtrC family response regulator
LNVFPIELPPLRERLSDVALLAQHFLERISAQEGKTRRFTPTAVQQLATYHWPGNVRELRNAVQRAYVMAVGDTIDESWLPRGSGVVSVATPAPPAVAAPAQAPAAAVAEGASTAASPSSAAESVTLPIGTSMAQAERALMLATLRHYKHHKERTAAVLGISLKTLYNRLKEYAAEEADAAEARPSTDA